MTAARNPGEVLNIRILGPPVGKGRPIASTVHGRVMMRTPAKTASWEGMAATVLQAQWGGPPIDSPCELMVVAVSDRPKRLQRKSDPVGRIIRTTKPDGDNVLKCVGDALKLAGVIRDDVLIWRWELSGYYAALDEAPHVAVRLVVA